MHRVRWLLTLGWLVLIASLFYDPITPAFTQPDNFASPFRINLEQCVKIREACLPQEPYSMSVLIWWAMIVPAGIFILLVFGHEFWRRICPLSFLSQIPRALKIQRKRKIVNPTTREVRYELVTIGENSWLGKNHLYVQFGLFFLGLGLRILFVNGDHKALAYFLIFTIVSAIIIGYLYAGKSWCNYFCPMAPVQMIYTGPRSLLGSQAHTTPKPSVTQSMCRTVDSKTGKEVSACVGCKLPCIDIDAEKTYWQELQKPGRRLVHYGYLGMVIAFYFYYYLYSGNWDYYFTGAWTHERDLLSRVFDPGFYIQGQSIAIPKFIAVFITYIVLLSITLFWGLVLEKLYRRYTVWRKKPVSAEQAQHVVFTLFTAISFWTFFSYGARPSLNRLPSLLLLGFNALVVLVGAIWLYRTLSRTHAQYNRESMSTSLRKQLQQFPIDPTLLDGRSLDELTSNEVYTLAKVLLGVSQQVRLQTYTGVVQDLLEQRVTDPSQSFEFCKKLRQDLQIQDSDHFTAIQTIATSNPELLEAATPRSAVSEDTETLARTVAKKPTNRTIARSISPHKRRR
ncbi:MAG TPA: calcium-binding protein [Coleofasciculaceae cyanobacterium]